MVRATAIFCFFLSRAVDSSSFLRFGAISEEVVKVTRTAKSSIEDSKDFVLKAQSQVFWDALSG
jgi:hypothetical protein